jgi:hypothetical protein
MPGSLDRLRQCSLVFSAGSRDTSRNDLASLSCKKPQCSCILIIDLQIFFRAKTTDLSATKSSRASCGTTSARLHKSIPLYIILRVMAKHA